MCATTCVPHSQMLTMIRFARRSEIILSCRPKLNKMHLTKLKSRELRSHLNVSTLNLGPETKSHCLWHRWFYASECWCAQLVPILSTAGGATVLWGESQRLLRRFYTRILISTRLLWLILFACHLRKLRTQKLYFAEGIKLSISGTTALAVQTVAKGENATLWMQHSRTATPIMADFAANPS